MTTARLDSRSWLVWGLAAMTPVLLGRNPWMLVEVLIIVVVVRSAWLPQATAHGMGWFLRLAAVVVAVSVVFNVLTVHAGDREIARLPEAWPIVGGPLTWNALLFGVLGGIALFTLVVIGVTVSTHIAWIDLFHVLPARLAPIAVTGSVAWAFLPQTAVAWRQIREAQLMRGHTFRRVKDFVPIVAPLLAGGLERSLMMAEALESRGFGAPATLPDANQGQPGGLLAGLGAIIGLVGIAVAAYCLAVGMEWWATLALAMAVLAFVAVARLAPGLAVKRTRYRVMTWSRADTLVALSGMIVGIVVIFLNVARPGMLAYRTYPDLMAPQVDLALLATLALLLIPAFVPGGKEPA